MANGKKKSRKKLYIFGGIGIVLIVLVLIVLLNGNKEEIIIVQTEAIKKRDITQTVSTTGKINSEFKVKITPEVTGEIVTLPVKEGQRVRKGELLIKIKADAYVAQKQRAEANLLSARSTLSMRKAELDKVTSDYNRTKELHSKGLSSDSELESVKSNFLSTKASFEGAQANVQQMEAALKESMEQLYKTTIYSPMDGTVSALNVELGERVLGSGFSQGTDIMTISDLGNMEAVVEVDENDVVLVSLGDTANIKVDAFGDKMFKGVVTQIGNSALTKGLGTQEQVVNFEVRVKIIDPDQALRPGMSCNATIETETIKNVLSVPIQSVTARNDMGNEGMKESNPADEQQPKNEKKMTAPKVKEIVFVVEGNKAKIKNVITGLSDDNFIEIKEGIKEGEKVVTGSYKAISRELNDGMNVKIEDKKPQMVKK